MSDLWDLGSASENSTIDFSSIISGQIRGVQFGDSGAKAYLEDDTGGVIRQITLTGDAYYPPGS